MTARVLSMTPPPEQNPLLAAALSYAALGWPVVPLHTPSADGRCSCRRSEPCKVGKHPRTANGLTDASADPAQVRKWWGNWPDANIGIVTGAVSGLVALDIDPVHNGDETLAGLLATYGALPQTLQSLTGSGGRHMFFRHPGRKIGNSVGRLGPGLDTRGDGGYVVAPPSLHASGRKYEWPGGVTPAVDVAPLPTWIALVAAPVAAPPRPAGIVTADSAARRAKAWMAKREPAVEGQGGDLHTFTTAANLVNDFGLDQATAWALLCEWNLGCQPPWSEVELRKKLDSAVRNGQHAHGSKPDRPQERPRLAVVEPPPHTDADAPPPAELQEAPVNRRRAKPVEGERQPSDSSAPARPENRPPFQVVKGDGHLAIRFAAAEIHRAPNVFERDGHMVTVSRAEGAAPPKPGKLTTAPIVRREAGAPIIAPVSVAVLWGHLSQLARWLKYDARSEGLVPCDPPDRVVAAVKELGSWPDLPTLTGIVTAPVLRRDGSVLDVPGYDEATGFLYTPLGEPVKVPERPTREDALRARDELLEVVCDFEFEKPAHKSGWLAFLLTPLARPAFDGNIPLFLVDANTAGAGKSRLCDCASIIVTGFSMARSRFTTDDDEEEKRVITHLQAGDSMVLFDNIASEFGGTTMDSLLTSEGWFSGRLLGKNSADARIRVRNNTCWCATSNNAALGGDLHRRCQHIRLESTYEHPEDRPPESFRHPELLKWVRAERPRLLRAALTLLRAYFLVGCPQPGEPGHPTATRLSPFGSYEAWSTVVRGAVTWVDLPDCYEGTRDGTRRADSATSTLASLLSGWQELDPQGKGITVGDAKRRLDADLDDATRTGAQPHYLRMRDAMSAALVTFDDGKVNAKKLGKRMEHARNKWIGGGRFVAVKDLHRETNLYAVERRATSNPAAAENAASDESESAPFAPLRPLSPGTPHRSVKTDQGYAGDDRGQHGAQGASQIRPPQQAIFGLREQPEPDDPEPQPVAPDPDIPTREPGEEG